MPKIILYGEEFSPPVRTCMMTLKALQLPYEMIPISLFEGEHLTENFKKKNPQHTIPTLEDEGHVLWDSHAIAAYLVSKYGKDDSLYPKDLLKRAVVDQRLHFESGVIFQACLRSVTCPMFFCNRTQIPQQHIDTIKQMYGFLEVFLAKGSYIAGDCLTIADFSIVSTVATLEVFAKIEPSEYPKLSAWMKRMESLPYYQEANGKGNQQFMEMIKAKNFTIVE